MNHYGPPRAVPLPGWVYVLTCESFPGCCKIGGTGRTAKQRAGELVGEYASGQPFTVIYREAVSDWPAVERAAHRMLSDCRMPRSELFRCPPRQAQAVVRAASRAHRHPWLSWPRAEPRRGPVRRYRRGTDASLSVAVLAGLLAAFLVVWAKPPVPGWLPQSTTRAMLWLERL